MDIDRFWQLIESARSSAATVGKPLDEVLVSLLADRQPQEILAYAARFDEVHDGLYRWDVWAAAYLIGGGCSDDGFIDFRAGVIALGREWYERTTAEPDSLAEHPAVVVATSAHHDEALFYEAMNYTASSAFERLTGDPDAFYEAWAGYLPADEEGRAEADMGEDFDFDDAEEMHRRLPASRGSISDRAARCSRSTESTNRLGPRGGTWPGDSVRRTDG
ncbi:hypothetical protein SSP24_52000 [Streptomyces spinoverrucosus]|uniref:DUF4240 domain-containing protein n=1 Tax=Streptomyces spinoverrucosus TaxID=284043 RepID=A0A4Y3VN36_9ACTN|nr:DUF4240 domain-containing protein [Streptomyces spinoverrucosus]GEC07545.1 hypothetical protein SSP24_52000 [Streptomyces spinoverrucosus]GHB63514.1 hypothetical protein GCM10010397_36990 [Streptomyces spinoverrucosus]